jgi:hypothetical protein
VKPYAAKLSVMFGNENGGYEMECGSTNFGTSVKSSAAGRLNPPSDRKPIQGLAGSSEKGEELTGRDLAEIVKLLECKLAWWGFQSVELGPFIRVSHHTISIDLLRAGGRVLCRVEVDRHSGKVDPSARRALSRLLNVSA